MVVNHCLEAILGGSLFGSMVSPIADDTLLTAVAANISVPDHLLNMGPYVMLAVGIVSFV